MPTAPLIAPDRGLGERALEPRGVAVSLEREPGELDPERRRLGMDPVRAPDAQGRHVLARARGQDLHQAPGVGQHEFADALDLQRQPGVEDVARRQSVVDPPTGRPGRR